MRPIGQEQKPEIRQRFNVWQAGCATYRSVIVFPTACYFVGAREPSTFVVCSMWRGIWRAMTSVPLLVLCRIRPPWRMGYFGRRCMMRRARRFGVTLHNRVLTTDFHVLGNRAAGHHSDIRLLCLDIVELVRISTMRRFSYFYWMQWWCWRLRKVFTVAVLSGLE